MSLKAKIEAVIYASEEPVTLAQLTGLLGHEAQAELDHLAAAQQTLTLEDVDSIPPAAVEASPESSEQGSDLPAQGTELPQQGTEAPAQETEAPEQGSEAPGQAGEDPTPEDKKSPRESKEDKEKSRRLRDYFRTILDQLIRDYATESNDRGLEIREIAGGYRLATKPEYHDAVRGFVKSLKPPLKLSLQALETLAVVAYKQPVTAPEISEIRGVDTGGVLGSLMARKLITTAGRKQVIGRPILYKTTKDFLLRFGLKDINELPSIEEFEKMAGELAEQEEIPMSHHDSHHAPESASDLEPERHTHAPQADGSPDAADNPLDDPLDDDPLDTPADASPLQDDFSDVRDSPDSPQDHQPDTVSTPEGDNEDSPTAPLHPAPEGLQHTPAIDTNKL